MASATTLIGVLSQLNHGCGHGCGTATMIGAATSTAHAIPAAVSITIGGLLLIGYHVVRVLFFPLGKCHRCKNRGILADKSGNHARICPRCHGVRPLRIGRRFLNYVIKVRRDAS